MEDLPEIIPSTQSIFFMPLLTHAYLIAKKIEISPIVLKNKEFVKKLKLLTNERYESILSGIVWLLTHNEIFLEHMEKSYRNIDGFGDQYSQFPTSDSIGHITGNLQEEILNNSYLSPEDYEKYFLQFKNIREHDPRIILPIFETIINCHYYPDFCNVLYNEDSNLKKYLKYKAKYLKLKYNLGK